MFLHEVPSKGIKLILKEAKRLLKPGGLMLHMELPPNKMLDPYNSFYLDWDSYYNKEPFYKPFRDMVPEKVCLEAGFSKNKYVEFIISGHWSAIGIQKHNYGITLDTGCVWGRKLSAYCVESRTVISVSSDDRDLS